MSYDKDVNVKLEDVNNSTNISLSIPMEYFWNKLSEDDLFNITKMFISNGYLTKIIKELINKESIEYGALGSYLDKEYIIFKETLISLIDKLKESYVNDLKEVEKMRWWSIGRSVERIIKIIYPDRKISYSVDPYDKGFYIIDKDNNNDNVLMINFIDWSYSINNEKVNGKDADSYFYSIYTELNRISRERKEYIGKWLNSKEENDKIKKNIKELEDRLSKYEKI